MHIVIFYGFIILQLGALDLILKGLIDRWVTYSWLRLLHPDAGSDGWVDRAGHGLCDLSPVRRKA